MEYKKRFTSIAELLRSEEYRSKDLSYCDLSDLDLTSFSWRAWIKFKFFHTGFRNTNIVFEPCTLQVDENNHYILEYCDFTDSDLSYIKDLNYVSFKGSKFKNTGLNVKLCPRVPDDIKDVVFSEEMSHQIRTPDRLRILDISTLEQNPHIPFTSLEIFLILFYLLPSRNNILTSDKCTFYSALADRALEEDRKRQGGLYKLYELLSKDRFSIVDKIKFFQGIVNDKIYDSIDLSDIPIDLLEEFKFLNCQFNEITLPSEKLSKLAIYDKTVDHKSHTIIPHVIIPGFDASSWKDSRVTRIGKTCCTIKRNLYLELGRACNGKCFWCRNQFLDGSDFDITAVMKSFRKIEPFLDNVVIGGGEPTLPQVREYLKMIFKTREKHFIKYFISTNGTCGIDFLREIRRYGYKINLSRHAIEDMDNDSIFGISTPKIEDIKCLSSDFLFDKYFTLVATCFEGGLDSVEALERYIELSDYLRVGNILFQTLHEDLKDDRKMLHQIDDMVFDEVIAKLHEQGYFVSELPIYSTGDYKLIIVRSPDGEKTISFKKYITKEELEKEWPRASKRTLDLSLAPNGDVFQNWHQSSDKVLCNLPMDKNKRP